MTKVPKLTNFQSEWIRKETAHYIYVDREEGGYKCTCSRCQTEVDLGKTKHRAKVICPSCNHEMEVMHKWRNIQPEDIDWVVIPKAIDNHTIMLRYVCSHRVGYEETRIRELARLVFETGTCRTHWFECRYSEAWEYSKKHYFRRSSMMNPWAENRYCCLDAKIYRQTWTRTLNRLKDVKYIDVKGKWDSSLFPHANVKLIIGKADLYDRLNKAGLSKLSDLDYDERLRYYDYKYDQSRCYGKGGIKYNSNETSLIKMLGITKFGLKQLRDRPNLEYLSTLQILRDVDNEMYDLVHDTNTYADTLKKFKKANINIRKTLRYCKKHGVTGHEYYGYYRTLEKLDYQLDDAYLFPADFYKEERRVQAELSEKIKAEEDLRLAERKMGQNASFMEIATALKNNSELREFFAGSAGLQIFVPESVDELIAEGRSLHNCLRTYIDRFANRQTLIFFVRRLEDPTAPYIAMEYCHGKVIQCRYDYNKPVDDEKIINFTEALAKKLAAQNILAA